MAITVTKCNTTMNYLEMTACLPACFHNISIKHVQVYMNTKDILSHPLVAFCIVPADMGSYKVIFRVCVLNIISLRKNETWYKLQLQIFTLISTNFHFDFQININQLWDFGIAHNHYHRKFTTLRGNSCFKNWPHKKKKSFKRQQKYTTEHYPKQI